MTRLKRTLVALCVLYSLCALAIGETVGADEHLRAVKRMLSELNMGEAYVDSARRTLAESVNANPLMADDLKWAAAQLTPSAAVDRMAPIYADYLTAVQADQLRRFFIVSPGNKVWRAMMAQVRTGKPVPPAPMTPGEKQTVDLFLRTSTAWRTITDSRKAITQRVEETSVRWGEELMRQRYAGMIDRLVNKLENPAARQDAGGTDPAPSASTAAAEQGAMAGFIALVEDISGRNAKISEQFAARTKDIEIGAVLLPANLTSRDRIENSRRDLARYETELSAAQRELNKLNDEFAASVNSLSGHAGKGNSLMQGAEKGLARAFERALRYEENQRRILSIMRQILNLAEERLGSIRDQDGRLIFDEPADLRLYESFRQQLMAEVKIEADIKSEQEAVRQNVLKQLARISTGDRPEPRPAAPLQPSSLSSPTIGKFPQPPPNIWRTPSYALGKSEDAPKEDHEAPSFQHTKSRDYLMPASDKQATPTSVQPVAEVQRTRQADSGPKRRFVSGYRPGEFHGYVKPCLERIADLATRNYPDEARGSFQGDVLISFAILPSGQLESVEVEKSSGNKAIDRALLQAVKGAAPFPPFPADIAGKAEALSITHGFSVVESASQAKVVP